jgi:hypothetical protein
VRSTWIAWRTFAGVTAGSGATGSGNLGSGATVSGGEG